MAALTDEAARVQVDGSFFYRTAGEVIATAVDGDPEVWSVRLLRWAGDRYEPTDEVVKAHSPFRWTREPRPGSPWTEPPYRKQVTAGPGERVALMGPHSDALLASWEEFRGCRYGVGCVLDDDPLKNY